MFEFKFTEEQQMLREMVRDFVNKELRPIAHKIDEEEKIPPEVLHIIPEPIARKQNIVAFRKTDRNLEVAMLDPEDLGTIEFIKKTADLKKLPHFIPEASPFGQETPPPQAQQLSLF